MTSTQSFSDVPDTSRQLAEPSETSGSPEAVDVYGEPNWVEVLMPARVHTGPSVDTPIIRFYAVGTPLRVEDYRGGWFEIIEPSTSKSGWIYSKYLGAISNPDQTQIASQEEPVQKVIAAEVSVPAKRYAKATPPSRATKVEPAKTRPVRVRPPIRALRAHTRSDLTRRYAYFLYFLAPVGLNCDVPPLTTRMSSSSVS
jgi:SH3 domain-containing protein